MKKLKIENITVKSFITALTVEEKNKINGGVLGATDPIWMCKSYTQWTDCSDNCSGETCDTDCH